MDNEHRVVLVWWSSGELQSWRFHGLNTSDVTVARFHQFVEHSGKASAVVEDSQGCVCVVDADHLEFVDRGTPKAFVDHWEKKGMEFGKLCQDQWEQALRANPEPEAKSC